MTLSDSEPTARTQVTRPGLRDLADAGWAVLSSALGLGTGIGVVAGVRADGLIAVLLAALLVLVVDTVLRPPLRVLASTGGVLLALLLGLASQVLVLVLALVLAPGVSIDGVLPAVLVLAIATAVMAVGRWLVASNDSAYALGRLLSGGRRSRKAYDPTPGLLVVQLDGVSCIVLQRAVEAGLVPTVARWLEQGSHTLTPWWAQVPCTTPASQAGLLHGDTEHVPAFRWWDREAGRLLVTNRPADAALVETRLSDGRGLLADGGVCISTAFSGDATTRRLVFSSLEGKGGLRSGGAEFVWFFAGPFVLARSLTLMVAEVVKELYQGRRQRRRGVAPRVPRRTSYVFLRGLTNTLLRYLNLSLVAQHLLNGAPSLFVDFVDYDEIAHHAGPQRPEAMRALEGLDDVLAQLERVLEVAPRPYDIVVLSDHGQSLGETFLQREGQTLTSLVQDLTRVETVTHAHDDEQFGPLNALVTETVGAGSHGRRLGPEPDCTTGLLELAELAELAVIASGNLGMIWFPRLPERPLLAELNDRYPALVPGLLANDSVGLVLVDTDTHGPVVLGRSGCRHLRDGAVEGADPVAAFGPHGAPDLLRLSGLRACGDLVVISTVDPAGRVHAFEEQVGSHGGLGGLQNDAFVLHPTRWVPDGELVGAASVFHHLQAWRAC